MNVKFKNLPQAFSAPVEDVLPLLKHELGQDVSVEVYPCATGFCVEKTKDGLRLSYARKTDFFRGLTFLNQVYITGETVSQHAQFSLLCYMIDVSRNAVLSMDGTRRLIRYLALMGYDSLMLYTEDTYELPGHPYFGHMRGRYTCEELRELDDYADSYGVEIIPCIQTLAHIRTTLRWSAYWEYRDSEDVLLVGDPRTYEMIDGMLKTVSSCFRSRRVHIGMDEAHTLGLGKYLDLHGYRDRFAILSEHLTEVKKLCDKYNLSPMIWSDMYFRLCNQGDYYMKADQKLPENLSERVPEGVGVVYWDYYTDDAAVLDNMFENHKILSDHLIFAGCAWKYTGFAPCNLMSYRRGRVHAEACVRNGCNDVIVTGWSDSGADASQFSALPSFLIYGELCYNPEITDEAAAKRFEELFSIPMEAFMLMDELDNVYGEFDGKMTNHSRAQFYNGVLGGLFDAHIPEGLCEHYLKTAHALLKYAEDPQFGYIFATLAAFSFVLEKKSYLSINIRDAYKEGKKDVLQWYGEKEIPEIISRIDDFLVLLRQQWERENKSFGFDAHEIRIGGLKEILRSAALRLKAYAKGEIDRIEELEQPVLPYFVNAEGKPSRHVYLGDWKTNITASVL